MSTLILYSSRTGNTEQLAHALAHGLPNSTLCSVQDVGKSGINPQNYNTVLVGYWTFRGQPDTAAMASIAELRNCRIGLFGTMAAYPNSEHATMCKERAAAMVLAPERGNSLCGSFVCQGKMDSAWLAAKAQNGYTHPMTEERKARLAEAAKHPNEEDFANAVAYFTKILAK